MTGYSIGEVAERTGFTASALRYYEGIGLVAPTGRTGGGYRIYDDQAVARLAFIARAKELGCTLDEITELADVWEGERCGPVQRRLHQLVTEKLAATERRIGELTAFTSQLRAAGAQLSQPASDGPCDDECACAAASRPSRARGRLHARGQRRARPTGGLVGGPAPRRRRAPSSSTGPPGSSSIRPQSTSATSRRSWQRSNRAAASSPSASPSTREASRSRFERRPRPTRSSSRCSAGRL